LGIALAMTCRLGNSPKLGLADVAGGLAWLIGTIALASFAAGAGTYLTGSLADARLHGHAWGGRLAPETHVAFLAVAVAHFTPFLVPVFGTIALCSWVGLRRYYLEQAQTRSRLEGSPPDGTHPDRQPDDKAPAR